MLEYLALVAIALSMCSFGYMEIQVRRYERLRRELILEILIRRRVLWPVSQPFREMKTIPFKPSEPLIARIEDEKLIIERANKNAGGPLKIIEKYVKSVSPVTGPEPPTPAPKKISKQEKK